MVAILSAVIAGSSICSAVEKNSKDFRIRYAVFGSESDLIIGDKTCGNKKICQIYSDKMNKIYIDIAYLGKYDGGYFKLTIRCEDYSCIFDSDTSFQTISRGINPTKVNFFKGERSNGLELRRREKIGEVIIKFWEP
jgi:hypothetical protein